MTDIPYRPQPTDFSAPVRYAHGPDSFPQPAVPQGGVSEHVWEMSRVFPATERRFWVYVPAQYSASEPASLMVFQDGWLYLDPEDEMRVPIVLDNLIHQGEMPVTMGRRRVQLVQRQPPSRRRPRGTRVRPPSRPRRRRPRREPRRRDSAGCAPLALASRPDLRQIRTARQASCASRPRRRLAAAPLASSGRFERRALRASHRPVALRAAPRRQPRRPLARGPRGTESSP